MRRSTAVVLGIILVGVVIWGWRVLFPNPERVIRKRLIEMAQLASFPPNEAPLAKLANTQKLAGYFAPDVEVVIDVPGQSRQNISGWEDLVQGAMAARNSLSALKVDIPDIAIVVGPDKRTAVANVTVTARIGGERDLFVQEMSIQLTKPGGTWLIKNVKTTSTLH